MLKALHLFRATLHCLFRVLGVYGKTANLTMSSLPFSSLKTCWGKRGYSLPGRIVGLGKVEVSRLDIVVFHQLLQSDI